MSLVDHYIYKQDEKLVPVLLEIRSILLTLSPKIEERYSYQLPFYYYRKKPFAYLGKHKSYPDKVIIGLCDGRSYSNKQKLLVGDGNIVRHIVLDPKSSYSEKLIQEVFYEGLIIIDQKLSL